jgi:hypothetical protein
MEIVNAHLSSAHVAMARGDARAVMDGLLAAVTDFPDKNYPERYDLLQSFGFLIHGEW